MRRRSSILICLAIATLIYPGLNGRAQQTPSSSKQSRILLLLRRTKDQRDRLTKRLADLQDPSSPYYHAWLGPEQFAEQFGASDSQISAIRKALEARGLSLNKVNAGLFFEVAGTQKVVLQTFTSDTTIPSQGRGFHRKIPSELAPLIEAVVIGHESQPVRGAHGAVTYDRTSHGFTKGRTAVGADAVSSSRLQPLTTGSDLGPTFYGVTPGDLAIQYSLPSHVQGSGTTIKGSGATVAVVSDSNVNLATLSAYGATFGIPLPQYTVVVDGADPGSVDESPAYFELEAIGAIAPSARVMLYTAAAEDALDPGGVLALGRVLSDDIAKVLLYPYQECESTLNADPAIANVSALFEVAAAEGITVIVPSGDSGSAACEQPFGAPASSGLAVNGVASSPYATAVGGTDFYYGDEGAATSSTYAQYWSTSSSAYTQQLEYVPEQAWNDSNQATDQNGGFPYLLAGGGGVSAFSYEAALSGNAEPYPQPWWQLGIVPSSLSQSARVLPDISLFAGDFTNNSSYVFCATGLDCANTTNQNASNLVFTSGSGTSVSAAIFAGMMALVVGQHGPQGNVNPTLYSMSQHASGVFNDVIYGTNTVSCSSGSSNCSNGFLVDSRGNPAYAATPGYDAATGLGSLNATALVQQWSPPNTVPTTTTITVTDPSTGQPVSSFPHGTPVNIKVTVAGAGGTPTGDVALIDDEPRDASGISGTVTLSGGTGTYANNVLLPGGGYHLYGRYSGDQTYQSSQSAAYSLNISSVPCTIAVFSQSPQSGATIPYGTPVSILMEPFNASNANDGTNATGFITVSDTGTALTTIKLDATGAGLFTSAKSSPRLHQLTFSYPGDSSFQSCSLSSPFNFTVTPLATTTTLTSSLSSVPSSNGKYTLEAVITPNVTSDQGAFPGGTVTFKRSNGTVLAASVPIEGFYSGNLPAAHATISLGTSGLSTGANSIIASYTSSGTGYSSSSSAGANVNLASASSLSSPAVTLSTSDGGNIYYDLATSVTLNAAATGIGNPAGVMALYINGTFIANMTPAGTGHWTYVLDSRTTDSGLLPLPLGTSTIVAQYSGDSASSAGAASLDLQILDDVVHPDFTISSRTDFAVLSGGTTSATFTVELSPLNGFTGTVSVVPTTPAGATCSIPGGSVSLGSQQYVSVTLTCSGLPTTVGTYLVDLVATATIPSTTPNFSTKLSHDRPLRLLVR